MELNVRDWLIILGSLVVAGFILDAYRRVRAGYSDKLRMSGRQRDNDDELNNPELPAGGARVVSRSKTIPSYETASDEQRRSDDSRLISDDESGDDPVPVLMDSVDEAIHSDGDMEGSVSERGDSVQAAVAALGELAFEPTHSAREQTAETAIDTPAEKSPLTARKPSGNKPDEANKQPDEIIVLHVVAAGDKTISGSALLQILLACDVRYGRMNIFHRYEEPGGVGAEQFSVVNMVAPGTFDLDAMDNFSSPGVSFFMKLPGPKEAIKAFDCMVETAQVLVKNLGCELQDEARSVCTPQTLQHLRQRIRDFERRQLTLV